MPPKQGLVSFPGSEKEDRPPDTTTALAVVTAFILIIAMIFFLLGQWIAAGALFVVFLALLFLPWIAKGISARKERIRREKEPDHTNL